MASYKVTWEIEIEADSAVEAAAEAREIQLDDMSQASVFHTKNQDTQERHEVDVGPLTLCKFCKKSTPTNSAHYHEGKAVCHLCWNERLRSTG